MAQNDTEDRNLVHLITSAVAGEVAPLRDELRESRSELRDEMRNGFAAVTEQLHQRDLKCQETHAQDNLHKQDLGSRISRVESLAKSARDVADDAHKRATEAALSVSDVSEHDDEIKALKTDVRALQERDARDDERRTIFGKILPTIAAILGVFGAFFGLWAKFGGK